MKRTLWTASALAGLATAPFAAMAQDRAAASMPADPTAQEGISDIIVTAQRKNENLQRAAVAVTALSGDSLVQAGVTQPQDLTKLVPALKLGTGGGANTNITLRGVGSFGGNGYSEPGVAINLDGVYIARASGPNGLFYDLERVEVLKGPQGTLYGRNATAGAVNIVTRKPDAEFSAQGSIEVGNYDKRRVELAVNAPIQGVGAVRVAGVISRRDGYFSDGYFDDRTDAVRAQLSLDQGGPLNVLLSADYAKIGGKGATGVISTGPYTFLASDPFTGPSRDGSNQLLRNVSNAITGGLNPNLLPSLKDDGFIDVENWGVAATVNYDLGGARIVVVPAFRRNKQRILHYNAGFPVENNDVSDTKSLEIRLSSDGAGPLQWLVGGYYFKEDLTFSLKANQGVAFGDTNPTLDTRSLAAFGQVTYAVADAFRVTGGVRYTNEKKTQAGRLGTRIPPADPLGALVYFPLSGEPVFENVTFKAGVEFDPRPGSLLYADVRTGFKAGGFFASAIDNTFKPEKLTAYTFGSKNRFLDNSLQINAEAFYWVYKDKQISHIGPVKPGGFNLITENAGKADLYGVEIESIWRPSPNDQFNVNLQYLHTEYKDFRYTQTTLVGPVQTACPFAASSATTVIVNCSGRPLPRAPEWTLDLSYRHTFDLNASGKIDAQAGTRIESSTFLGEEYLPGEFQPGYRISNASLTWRAADNGLSITAFVDNIEDKFIKTGAFVQPVIGQPLVVPLAPRTYGARVQFSF